MSTSASISARFYMESFEDKNLPAVMKEAANWMIADDINVTDVVISAFGDDMVNEILPTWRVTVYYVVLE